VTALLVPGHRTLVIGVLNVTPDSFSDGGAYLDSGLAVHHAEDLVRAGADVIDVGGESTRPGAVRVSPQEESRRVLPVIEQLVAKGITVSIDTSRGAVAGPALAAGAALVNDVSGGSDRTLLHAVAAAEVPYVCMHTRGDSSQMTQLAHYNDVVAEVCTELAARSRKAEQAGIAPERIVLDPGIGFAKTAEHNWALLARIDRLMELGRPVLVGVSRKSFLGRLLADGAVARPVTDREDATQALTALLAAAGVWGVRVHEARPAADAVRVAAAWRAAAGQESMSLPIPVPVPVEGGR
jgi:dihydropteroate synthase